MAGSIAAPPIASIGFSYRPARCRQRRRRSRCVPRFRRRALSALTARSEGQRAAIGALRLPQVSLSPSVR